MAHQENELPSVNERLFTNRRIGAKGTTIRMHRALRSMNFRRSIVMTMVLLPLIFSFALWVSMEPITSLWAKIFDFWIWKLELKGHVSYLPLSIFGQQVYIPYPNLPIIEPTSADVWMNLLVSIFILVVSLFLPKRYAPALYLLRAAMAIQISASAYFLWRPEGLPYDIGNYVAGMLVVGLYIMLLITPMLAAIYYVFGFAFWRKLVATVLILGYFVIALPFQYLVHAIIICYWSPLFMPLLYLLFGALLNVLMFVSWYSWAMTWRGKDREIQAITV